MTAASDNWTCSLWQFLRRWLRRCPDCGVRGCKGTPDSQLRTFGGRGV